MERGGPERRKNSAETARSTARRLHRRRAAWRRAVLALGGCAHALGGLRGEAACPRLGRGVGHERFFTTTALGPGGGGETLRPSLRAVANW